MSLILFVPSIVPSRFPTFPLIFWCIFSHSSLHPSYLMQMVQWMRLLILCMGSRFLLPFLLARWKREDKFIIILLAHRIIFLGLTASLNGQSGSYPLQAVTESTGITLLSQSTLTSYKLNSMLYKHYTFLYNYLWTKT